MPQSPDIRYDVASAISQGRRAYQEDAIVTDFPLGADLGFAVLADGMGGHAAGDVASKIVVTEVYSELKLQSGDLPSFEKNLPRLLRDAAMSANDCVKGHIETHVETAGMGATLLCPVFLKNRLYWISIGDSPLFLFRDGELTQLNEDHSMAPQIDFMIRSGMMTEDIGRNHPDRSCLTSVLGGEQVARIDCPSEPTELQDGDILIVASDGLQYLGEGDMVEILKTHRKAASSSIAGMLLAALEGQGDPEQDNASFSVVKVRYLRAEPPRRPAPKPANDDVRADEPAPAPAPAPVAAPKLEPASDKVLTAAEPSRIRSALFTRRASFFRNSTS